MKRLLWCLVLCSILIMMGSGCVPEFKNPLPQPENLKPDAILLGNWVNKEYKKGDVEFMHVLVFARADGWMEFVEISRKESDKGVEVYQYEGYSTSVGKDKFLCFRPLRTNPTERVEENMRNHAYWLAHYKVNRRTFHLTIFSESKIETLIEAGELKSEIVEVENIDDFTVTSSSEALTSLIAKKGVETFIDKDEVNEFSRAKR